jgi:polyhydroxyalkanoate synthesis regulator phasin
LTAPLKEIRRVPIEQLKVLPEYALLPENQRKFLECYICNNYDVKAAVMASYPKAKTEESVRVMGSRILNSPGVVMLLHLHYGDDPKDAFCKMVQRMVMRGRISKEQLEAMKLVADVREFRQPWTPRYEKKVRDGMANNKQAVKRRVQRAAMTQAVNKVAAEGGCGPSLMPDFEKL